jgi:hypothetical protein
MAGQLPRVTTDSSSSSHGFPSHTLQHVNVVRKRYQLKPVLITERDRLRVFNSFSQNSRTYRRNNKTNQIVAEGHQIVLVPFGTSSEQVVKLFSFQVHHFRYRFFFEAGLTMLRRTYEILPERTKWVFSNTKSIFLLHFLQIIKFFCEPSNIIIKASYLML